MFIDTGRSESVEVMGLFCLKKPLVFLFRSRGFTIKNSDTCRRRIGMGKGAVVVAGRLNCSRFVILSMFYEKTGEKGSPVFVVWRGWQESNPRPLGS